MKIVAVFEKGLFKQYMWAKNPNKFDNLIALKIKPNIGIAQKLAH